MMTPRSLVASMVAAAGLGCGGEPLPKKATKDQTAVPQAADAAAIKHADVSVLFVGNSHTGHHDVPDLIGRMIRFVQPEKTYVSRHVGCAFLEDAASNAALTGAIEKEPWKVVVLQAQKISMSGKYKYSQKEGVGLAKAAKAKGMRVLFFSEWGRRDVPGDGVVQEAIYDEMATAAGVRVAPVGRAWDVALAAKSSLPLYDADGNHESAAGAFLTACVFYGLLTDGDPADLAGFEHAGLAKEDRTILAKAASNVWREERGKKQYGKARRLGGVSLTPMKR